MPEETRQTAKGHHIAQADRGGYALSIDARRGLTPEQVRAYMLDVLREESPALAKVEELSQKLNATREAVVGFFKILKRSEVPFEKLPETLAEIAQRHQETLERLAVLNPEDPAIKALIDEAQKAIEAGDYDRADVLLHQAEVAELTAARQAQALAQQAQAAAEKRWLNAAATRAERGEISLTRLNYPEAAAHFKAASDLVPLSYPQAKGEYLRRQADALSEYGDQKGDNAALRQAIPIYQEALNVLTRARVPLDWAATQNNLGNALQTLGERESGTERLEQAVAAYRLALEERTRARVPLGWAMTQNNLGNALRRLGERESGTERLEEAVEAYRLALEERTRERVPLDWAMTQNNLGIALQTLGEREGDIGYFKQAKIAIQSAYAVWKEAGYDQYDEYFEETLRSLEQVIAQ